MHRAEAVSHGAITIVNAMATGKGAALGIRLLTKAKVELTDEAGRISCRIMTDAEESTSLLYATVMRVLRKYGAHRKFGANVETTSNIPIAVGLKSSSAASNAVALATVSALGRRVNDLEIVQLAVKSSLDAGVTLTGAFDDASACYFGGLIVADNRTNEILKRSKQIDSSLHVLIYIPHGKKYSGAVRRDRFKKIESLVNLAHKEAINGNYPLSMTLNGVAYCRAFGYDISPATDALQEGAIAAGLSGKGPAIAAIVPNKMTKRVLSAWASYPGRVIETRFNFDKARVRVTF
ncbi:MAG TPA: shikimate kinase [Candidatus Bathyarchaeia archaeon]|nr:shikimate kinase [Candidatus Bathyarchaeia archaeon]